MSSFNFRSYFKFLSRNKGYTAINLIGFSVSLAFVILLGLYVQSELKVDRFHKDGDRIYRLTSELFSGTAYPIAEELKSRYPEIESFTRMKNEDLVIQHQDKSILADVRFVDSTFFSIFSFPIQEGNRDFLMPTLQDAVVTESFARNVFGTTSAVGQTFHIDSVTYTVNGVAADFENSHIENPDILLRVENVHKFYKAHNNANAFFLYLKTYPETDLQAKIPDIIEYFKGYYWPYKDERLKELYLEPLPEVYFQPASSMWSQGIVSNSKTFIYILLMAALAVLVFAVMNYINLSVAQNGFRAREAGIRRLLGGSRGALFGSYIQESVLFVFGAFCLAVLLALLLQDPFNQLLGSEISILKDLQGIHVIIALGAVVFLGTLSGLIPAFAVTNFTPIDVVRGTYRRKTKMVYSRIFICIQYTITIILLGCALTIMKQTHFMRTTDLGFERENIVIISHFLEPERKSGLRDRLGQISGVEAVSFTRGTPIGGGNNNTVNYDDRPPVSFQIIQADSLFWQILNIEKISSTGNPSPNAFWVNEETLRALDLPEDATEFKMHRTQEIAGVYKTFHFRDLSETIGPLIIQDMPKDYWPWETLVKISGRNQGETYRQIVDAYEDYIGGIPVESYFMDEEINRWYIEQEKTYKIIGYFSFIAIVIAALGLLAMATYFMRQQAANVAVRKVFGSTNREILERLIFSFLKIVLVSFVLAVPVIWYAMSEWLKGYAYRIPLSWTLFALAGAIAFAIAFAAVFWQSYRATTANPINVLKNQ